MSENKMAQIPDDDLNIPCLNYDISKKISGKQASLKIGSKTYKFYIKSEYSDEIIRDYIRDGSFEFFRESESVVELKLKPFNNSPLTSSETIIVPKVYDDFIQEAADLRQYFGKISQNNFIQRGQTIILSNRKWFVDKNLNLVRA